MAAVLGKLTQHVEVDPARRERSAAGRWRGVTAMGAARDPVGLVTDSPQTADPGNNSPGAGRSGRPEHVRQSIDGSLRRLRTDHVDLYQLHGVNPQVPLEETWGAMAGVVAAGKARHIGLSEVTVEEIDGAGGAPGDRGAVGAVAIDPECARRCAAALPETRHRLPAVLAAGTRLPHRRFSSFDDLPQEDFRRGLPRFQQAALRANLAIVGQVRKIAERAGATSAQVALAWVLAQGRYVIPIPRTKSPRYLLENAVRRTSN